MLIPNYEKCMSTKSCLILVDEFGWFNLQATVTYSLLSRKKGVLLIPSLNRGSNSMWSCRILGLYAELGHLLEKSQGPPVRRRVEDHQSHEFRRRISACRGLGDKHCWKWPAGPYLGTWANWGECTWPVICSQGGEMFTQISSRFIQWECFLLHTQIGRVVFLPQMNVHCKTKARQTANDLYTGLAQLVIRVKHLDVGYTTHGFLFSLDLPTQIVRLIGICDHPWIPAILGFTDPVGFRA